MAIFIAAVHLDGGSGHEHITGLVWVLEGSYKSGISAPSNLVTGTAEGLVST